MAPWVFYKYSPHSRSYSKPVTKYLPMGSSSCVYKVDSVGLFYRQENWGTKLGRRGEARLFYPCHPGSKAPQLKFLNWCLEGPKIECPGRSGKNTGQSGCSIEEFPYLLGIPPEILLVSMLWLNKKALCHDGPEAKVEKGTYQPTQAERVRGQLPAGCTKQGTVWSQRYTEARDRVVNPRLIPQTGLWEHHPWFSFYSQVRNLDLVHSYSWAPVSWSQTFCYT